MTATMKVVSTTKRCPQTSNVKRSIRIKKNGFIYPHNAHRWKAHLHEPPSRRYDIPDDASSLFGGSSGFLASLSAVPDALCRFVGAQQFHSTV